MTTIAIILVAYLSIACWTAGFVLSTDGLRPEPIDYVLAGAVGMVWPGLWLTVFIAKLGEYLHRKLWGPK